MTQSDLTLSATQATSDDSDATRSDNLPTLPMRSYRCRWIKCTSKLHNLATLRGHIFKRHHPDSVDSSEQEFVCWWNRCEHLAIDEDDNVKVTHFFKNEQEWRQHIEEKHVQPIARKFGDGPSTNTEFFKHADHYKATLARRRFLSDANGCEATPFLPANISQNSEYPPRDVLELMPHYPEGQVSGKAEVDVKARRAFLKAHGAKPDDQRSLAEETVRAMAVRKQKIGPGIDRGGCTLINEARRATFVQAPGILRLIDADSDCP